MAFDSPVHAQDRLNASSARDQDVRRRTVLCPWRPRLASTLVMLRWLFHAPRAIYAARAGPLLGHRFLLLHHRGRRTGNPHATVLEVIAWDAASREAVVISGFGRRAQWLRNVLAAGAAEIEIARERWPAAVRPLGPAEGRPCWPTTSGATGSRSRCCGACSRTWPACATTAPRGAARGRGAAAAGRVHAGPISRRRPRP